MLKIFKNRYVILSLLLFILVCFGYVGVSGFVEKKKLESMSVEQRFDYELESAYEKAKIPGVAVAVFSKDRVLYEKELGYADVQQKIPFTLDTVMNIGSISKTFISAALMKAVEDELLSLDEDINHILPFQVVNPNSPEDSITLRNLATHTSGIKDDDDIYAQHSYYSLYDEGITLKDFLYNYLSPDGEWYKRTNFLNESAGTSYEYSNIASALAAYCIEVKSGIPYEEYVREHIFNELNMHHSGWSPVEFNSDAVALNYSKERIDFKKKEHSTGSKMEPLAPYKLATYPDGGVFTSVNDLSTFLLELMRKQDTAFLSSESIAAMLEKQFNDTNIPHELKERKHNSGLFWDYTSLNSWGHTGGDPGINTFMYVKESGVAAIMFMNCDVESIGQDTLSKFHRILNRLAEVEGL
ncbi:beta-lactamase family protein [Paenibacillus sp. J5C_2022]|uniref:serine hydrolase domain-containing protein n=1 Tax=Paenibacillus sp. J5C2022 TaxID=2977129 RepID=UPI0021D1C1FD|nr:serine hydrolase domain-containing protein [Paenibacillus sp. J5C2022]MCU6709148.1 beta-lactamase family protein [Paenibacillus sp. J5C2022]